MASIRSVLTRWLLTLGMAAAVLPAAVGSATPASAEANGVATTPPMGWSSWSYIRSNPTEADIEAQAKAMSTSGLVAHGYRYVNIDDFWYLDPKTTVDAYGRWETDPARFPHGMAAVADYVHGLGEKFGMYLTPGIPVAAYQNNTPIAGTSFHARDIVSDTSRYETNYNFGSGRMYYIDYTKNPAAAQAYLDSWADQLASLGVDYLKMDGVGDGDMADVEHWSQALRQTGRPIHFELSNSLDVANAATWRTYANGWRVSGDVECYCGTGGSSFPLTDWSNVSARFSIAPKWTPYVGPGGWMDLDSVEVGNGDDDGLTPDERRTQLTLWAIEGAPLLLGTDLTHLDAGDLKLLTNDEVIGVDQAGHPAHPVDQLTSGQVWAAPNGDGSYTVALFNLGSSTATVTANWSDIGFTGSAAVRDLWSHTDLGSATGSFGASLAPHASRLLRVTPAAGSHPAAMPYALVNDATGEYLDVAGASTADGAGIVQSASNGAADQRWLLLPAGDGTYTVENVASGKVLHVPSGGGSGAQLIQSADDHAAGSHWNAVRGDDGTYQLTARSNGLAADTQGGEVVQATASSATTQRWSLVPEPDPGTAYKLVNGASGGRMDVDGDSTADGATVLQWQDNGQADQRWTLAPAGGGAYTVTNANSGKLLNVPGPTTAEGTQLIQYHDDGNSNSRWTLVDAGPNAVQLRSVYDGDLVDLDNSSLSDGAAVLQWPADSGANQTWTLVPAN
ncbi:alpha-galactosidase [Streptomyces sp. PTM05]|uniref:Alpha-galactosidase n=1 Tax=Streptantibioticus parmotrematis TaxID=2873249 RepID=A0ABS7QNC5_9ACTN|nr:alpha-galactosidase [Streptantibioticus parmotrematis]MBY8883367.1 alpha-galactosidase [Streptantibioticus parmotrematis]